MGLISLFLHPSLNELGTIFQLLPFFFYSSCFLGYFFDILMISYSITHNQITACVFLPTENTGQLLSRARP